MHTPALAAPRLRAFASTYPGTPEHIARSRQLRRGLGGCPDADDVILCVSELAANAVLHSNSGKPGGTYTVRAEGCPGASVCIEVEDDGGPWIGKTSPQSGQRPGAQHDRYARGRMGNHLQPGRPGRLGPHELAGQEPIPIRRRPFISPGAGEPVEYCPHPVGPAFEQTQAREFSMRSSSDGHTNRRGERKAPALPSSSR